MIDRRHVFDPASPRTMTLQCDGEATLDGMKVREIVAIIEADGWRLVRIRGSHHHYKHPTKPGVVTVPGARNDDLAFGTVRSVYKQAGLTPRGRGKEDK